MDLTSFLLPLIFLAFILYRVYKKKDKTKDKDNQYTKDKNKNNTKEIEVIETKNTNSDLPLHRIYLQAVDFDKAQDSMKIAVSVESLVSEYLGDVDTMGAVRPRDIRFFTNYNRIFIVYIW